MTNSREDALTFIDLAFSTSPFILSRMLLARTPTLKEAADGWCRAGDKHTVVK